MVAAPEEERQYIEFYRLDLSAATRAILLPAALLVTFGAAFVCVAAARIPIPVSRDTIGLFGASIVLSGLVLGFGGMGRLLTRDGFVGVTRDGLHVRADSRNDFVAWDDLVEIRGGPRLELMTRAGHVIVLPRVATPAGVVLRERLEDLRRKASLHLLGPRG